MRTQENAEIRGMLLEHINDSIVIHEKVDEINDNTQPK